MPLIQTDSQHYSDIADAIRDMSGNEETFYPSEMAAGVRSIPQTIAIAPIIYSLEEREVGVWTDGKPLYQKSYVLTAPSTSASTDLFDTTDLNIDLLIKLDGVIWIQANTTHTGGNSFILWERHNPSNGNKIATQITNSAYQGGQMYVTLLYTKTTDTPGSGTWTPSGVPAHHYSTDEQVIGTWIDGKPLYEITYNFTLTHNNITGPTTYTYPYPSIMGSVDKAFLHDTDKFVNVPRSFSSQDSIGVFCSSNSNGIIVETGKDRSTTNITIVIRYTKTTD